MITFERDRDLCFLGLLDRLFFGLRDRLFFGLGDRRRRGLGDRRLRGLRERLLGLGERIFGDASRSCLTSVSMSESGRSCFTSFSGVFERSFSSRLDFFCRFLSSFLFS